MDNFLLAVRDINHKYIVVERHKSGAGNKRNRYFSAIPGIRDGPSHQPCGICRTQLRSLCR